MIVNENGCRFTFRPSLAGTFNAYDWRHPLEAIEGDIDCTDMDDDEFEQFVMERA